MFNVSIRSSLSGEGVLVTKWGIFYHNQQKKTYKSNVLFAHTHILAKPCWCVFVYDIHFTVFVLSHPQLLICSSVISEACLFFRVNAVLLLCFVCLKKQLLNEIKQLSESYVLQKQMLPGNLLYIDLKWLKKSNLDKF